MCSSRRRSRKLIYCHYREPFKSVSSSFPRPMLGNMDSGKFCVCNYSAESGKKIGEPGIQLKDSGILLTIGIQNSSSIDKDWNPVPGIWNPRPSWVPLHRTNISTGWATKVT